MHGRLGPELPNFPGPQPKRTTLAQVAALAGVSVSTASLAFSGSGPVSGSTRDRVLAAAETLHYAGPDPRGQSLRRGRSGIIGVVLEERVLDAFRDPIKIAFLDGIAQETTPGGRGLLLLADAGESSLAMEMAAMDGVVLIGCSPRIARSVEIIRRRRIPVVSLGGPPMDGVLTISLDDRDATESAARHLWDLGHRDVAIVALPLVDDRQRGALTDERESAATVQVTSDRLRGARAVFPKSGGVVSAGSFVDEGMIAGHTLLDDPDHRPTAIIAQSDLLAAGVIKTAEELGLRVPADLSVVGFDGIALDRIIPHDLTTLTQPAAEQGRAAGRAVLDLLDGGQPGSVRFVSTFHLGGTTAPPRRHRAEAPPVSGPPPGSGPPPVSAHGVREGPGQVPT
jgi:DNA-binding LacI/PurR family transcriptional regulator